MRHNRKILYLAGFLFSLPLALNSYINSSFLSSFVNEKLVGVIYTLASLCSILALIIAPKIFRKIGVYKFLISIALLCALSILAFAFAESALSAIPIFVIGLSLNTLVVFSLDELLKIFSKNEGTGVIRGTYLAIASLAWIIAQLALGLFLGEFSFKIIYLTSFSIMMLFVFISLLKLKNIPDPEYDQVNNIKYVGDFFRNRNLARSYGLSWLLHFFFCWMIIYTPIYLSAHLGFTWKEIGIIFAVMLLPFSILPFSLGKYSDIIGERKMLMYGYAITGISTLALFFIQAHSVFIWALMLFITRVGAATIETMVDVYFFKHIRPENEQYIGVYRSVSPVAFIIGPLFASLIFIFIPSFNYIYLILGTIMLYGIYLASTIRKSDI